MNNTVTVNGAGLAGSEAAWQLAQRGIQGNLIEMRPVKSGPATTPRILQSWSAPTPSGATGWRTPWAF